MLFSEAQSICVEKPGDVLKGIVLSRFPINICQPFLYVSTTPCTFHPLMLASIFCDSQPLGTYSHSWTLTSSLSRFRPTTSTTSLAASITIGGVTYPTACFTLAQRLAFLPSACITVSL